MKGNRLIVFLSVLGLSLGKLFAQQTDQYKDLGVISVQSDTNLYSTDKHMIRYQNETYLFFNANPLQKVYVITVFPAPGLKKLSLLPSGDFDIIDSLVLINGIYFKAKLEFDNLGNVHFPRLVFAYETNDGHKANKELKLYPYMNTSVQGINEVTELFSGEELTLSLPANNVENIAISDAWQTTREMDYRISKENNKLMLQVKPLQMGSKELQLQFKTIKPYLDKENKPSNYISPVTLNFSIKPSRLNFINFSRGEFFLDLASSGMEEIQIDYSRNFNMKQLYRIEDKAEGGGKLIAELFTQSYVANSNKILCLIRLYSLHRTGEGYLYIKEGNETKYITNFNVFEKPKLEKMSLQREGEEWTTNLSVYPGEEVEIRVEGTGLLKASMEFEGCTVKTDTIRRSDNVNFYFVKIPQNVHERKIPVYVNKRITTYELYVREYQAPRDFDFVNIDYDGRSMKLTDKQLNKPVLYKGLIKDININFQPELIDQNGKYFGKQYLIIEVKIFNAKNELKEFQTIDNIVLCPGDNSLRAKFYDPKDCRKTPINLNDFLGQKTYDLETWSRIEIVVKHKEAKYNTPIYSKKLVLIKEKKYAFDLQVSFPAGMLVKKFNTPGVGNLTGISTSVIAQLSFYDPQRVGRLKPYNIGAGFIAVDAFSLNSNSVNKDLGIVLLGSLYPVQKEKKFSFPIFAGVGYLLKSNTMFLVFGPGVQFNF
jgi:hypothetical protein